MGEHDLSEWTEMHDGMWVRRITSGPVLTVWRTADGWEWLTRHPYGATLTRRGDGATLELARRLADKWAERWQLIALAVSDPGHFVPRPQIDDDHQAPMVDWQTEALIKALEDGTEGVADGD